MRTGNAMTMDQNNTYGIGLYEGMAIVMVSIARIQFDPDKRERDLAQARGHWWTAARMRVEAGIGSATFTPDLYLDPQEPKFPHVFSIKPKLVDIFDPAMRAEDPIVR